MRESFPRQIDKKSRGPQGERGLEFSRRKKGQIFPLCILRLCFPGGSENKASAYNAGDPGSVSGLGRCPGEGNGNPLQYSCLENPMDCSLPGFSVHGVAKSRTRLSDFTFTFTFQCILPEDSLWIKLYG